MAEGKIRLDLLLVERGLARSRSEARALILEGRVLTADRRLDKPGTLVPASLPLRLKQTRRFVSRGGEKLEAALRHFRVPVAGAVALDVGASTGGFTDALLHHGAARVYAVDVGYGQLHWKLRGDPRVVVLERTHARDLDRDRIPEPIELLVCDVSFISLRQALPRPLALCRPGAWLVALIKPQFELDRAAVGKGGVVRDPALHEEACRRVRSWLAAQPGWRVLGVMPSPLLGPKGNREFLLAAVRGDPSHFSEIVR